MHLNADILLYILFAEPKWHFHFAFNSIQFSAEQQHPCTHICIYGSQTLQNVSVTMQMILPFVAFYYNSVDDDGDTEELITIANWIEANKFQSHRCSFVCLRVLVLPSILWSFHFHFSQMN